MGMANTVLAIAYVSIGYCLPGKSKSQGPVSSIKRPRETTGPKITCSLQYYASNLCPYFFSASVTPSDTGSMQMCTLHSTRTLAKACTFKLLSCHGCLYCWHTATQD